MARAQESSSKVKEKIARLRIENPDFARWAAGYGVIRHSAVTQARIVELESRLAEQDNRSDGVAFYELLHALDRVTSAAMWLVVHETYARNVYLDGRNLVAEDFKPRPEGHTGGALNMVPAYAGYLAIDALTGITRAWLMGQGHCVAAIDSLNLLVGNMMPAHAERYSVSDEGLTRYVRDFYSYRMGADGKQDSPLGSHVNAHTAGGLAEGGYLGFAELQYVHMPLPEALRASRRLAERDVAHTVVYLFEPGRFRVPRSTAEQDHLAPAHVRSGLFPETIRARLLVTHTRPESVLGLLEPFRGACAGLGYINRGGTYDTPGLLFVNRSSWAHCVDEVARLLELPRARLLSVREAQALDGELNPQGVIIPEVGGEGGRP